jgi:molecular chaperone IbpA
MTRYNSIIDNFIRNSIGFEPMYDVYTAVGPQSGFPFWNYIKEAENKFRLEIAVAGYAKEDITVTLKDQSLNITSKGKNIPESDYIQKGFAVKPFTRLYTIHSDVSVNDIQLENGVLSISLERIVPDEKKERILEIGQKPKLDKRQYLVE